MVQEVLKIGAETLQTFTRLDRHPFYLRSARRVALAAASTSDKFGTLTCKIQQFYWAGPIGGLSLSFLTLQNWIPCHCAFEAERCQRDSGCPAVNVCFHQPKYVISQAQRRAAFRPLCRNVHGAASVTFGLKLALNLPSGCSPVARRTSHWWIAQRFIS
jgi:hypothetical protein